MEHEDPTHGSIGSTLVYALFGVGLLALTAWLVYFVEWKISG